MRALGVLAAVLVLVGAASAAPSRGRRNIVVSVSGPTAPVAAGTEVVYRVTVRNRGPRAARSVRVSADVPISVHTVAAPAGTRCQLPAGPGRVTCRIARLRSHARIVIVLMGAASAVGSPPPTPSAQARDLPLALASFCPVGGREGPCLQVDDPPGLEQLTPLHVAPGDVIVIRVGFQPTRLSLTVGSTGPIELAPSTAATWTVPAGFSAPPPGVLVSIFAEGQSAVATYRGRLET